MATVAAHFFKASAKLCQELKRFIRAPALFHNSASVRAAVLTCKTSVNFSSGGQIFEMLLTTVTSGHNRRMQAKPGADAQQCSLVRGVRRVFPRSEKQTRLSPRPRCPCMHCAVCSHGFPALNKLLKSLLFSHPHLTARVQATQGGLCYLEQISLCPEAQIVGLLSIFEFL
jgi:hypothetical protein